MTMYLVSDTKTLSQECKRLAASEFVAVDTEFMRESTFWPQLCLIQMASHDGEVIVDTLSSTLDLSPFFELMADGRVLKVFHAGRQDIEIIHHLSGAVPHPVFDSQVAAMVCGFGESASYSILVKKLLNIQLDKSSRFTDWSRRPLAEKQLQYALADVTHLRDLFPKLKAQVEAAERSGWLDEEMAVLTGPTTYDANPQEAWRRLKMRVKTPKALAIMMEIAAWRDTEAQAQDVPRNRIIKDDAIYDLANQAPRDKEELGGLRSIHGGFARSARAQGVLDAIERGLQRDPATVPRIKRNAPLQPEAIATIDLLRVLLKTTAARHGVAPKLIATSDDLEKIARSDDADVAALQGWRRDLFGADALALKRGELALSMGSKGVAVVKADGLAHADENSRETGLDQDATASSGPAGLNDDASPKLRKS